MADLPNKNCIDAGLTGLKEVCDLTSVKPRVLFKWFHERPDVFNMVLSDAVYIKTGVHVEPVPSQQCHALGLGKLASVWAATGQTEATLYKWAVENKALLSMILLGAAQQQKAA